MARRGTTARRGDGRAVRQPGVPLGFALPDLPGALCAQADPEEWFPERGGSPRVAREICGRCPERVPCLEWAVATGERYGIWGGATEHERRTFRSESGPSPEERREVA